MSEPTKGLPDEELLKQWASDYAKSEHNKGYIDSMAAEILRLRAELAKASAEVQRLTRAHAKVVERIARAQRGGK